MGLVFWLSVIVRSDPVTGRDEIYQGSCDICPQNKNCPFQNTGSAPCTEITNALVLKEFTEVRLYTSVASDRQPDSDWLHGKGHD